MATSAQQQNSASAESALSLNDLVCLPIIITDFDAEGTTTSGSDKKTDETGATPPQAASSDTNCRAGEVTFRKWSTGFNGFADEIWKSMTATMRSKLREAAVEVLKRTDDTKSGAGGSLDEGLWGRWDEDARFLD